MRKKANPFIDFTKWILKWLVFIVSGLICIILLLIYWSKFSSWWEYDRHKEKIAVVVVNTLALANLSSSDAEALINDDFSSITTEGLKELDKATKKTGCTVDYPIEIAYFNNSSKTIENIELDIKAYLPERSTNILDWLTKVSYDYITQPNEGRGSCWKLAINEKFKNDPGILKATYEGQVQYVIFKE